MRPNASNGRVAVDPLETTGAFYLVTYALERSDVAGELTPEAEGFETEFRPLRELRASPDRIRASDLERIELAFDS